MLISHLHTQEYDVGSEVKAIHHKFADRKFCDIANSMISLHKDAVTDPPPLTDTMAHNDGECHLPKAQDIDIDTMISKELLQLSLGDRNKLDEEIHGVSTLAPEESPELLEQALLQLAEEIEGIPDKSPAKAAYLESQSYPNTYVNTKDFRLKFLRCDLFDVPKAAMRMMKFLTVASEFFGPQLLRRPMRYSDLTKGDEKILRKGFVQILPYRDRAGRPIHAWVGDFDFAVGRDPRSRARIVLYFLYSTAADIESQRKGLVQLTWGREGAKPGSPTWSDVRLFSSVFGASPIRIVSFHFCFPDTAGFHILRTMYSMTLLERRSRIKFHIGEEVELLYTLKSYGIPVELIPVTGTGNIKTVHQKRWIQLQRTLDETRAKGVDDSSIIEMPGSTDVIFRTGTSLTCHPGNSFFQSIIESKIEEHSAASQGRKIAITKEIIDIVRQKNGRFLQWDSRGWWAEIEGASQIHTKVAVSVRDFKSKAVAQKNRQSSASSTSVFLNQDAKRRKTSHVSGNESDTSINIDSCCLVEMSRIA